MKNLDQITSYVSYRIEGYKDNPEFNSLQSAKAVFDKLFSCGYHDIQLVKIRLITIKEILEG